MGGWLSSALSFGSGNDKPVADLVRGVNRFGFASLKALGGKGNFLFSPLSAFVSFSMCPSLFLGDTRREILQTLGVSETEDDSSFGERLRSLLSIESSRSVFMYCRLVVNKSKSFPSGFFDVLKDCVGVPPEVCGFPQPACDIVNRHVKESTHGMIDNIVSEGSLAEASTILVNSIYFECEWVNHFDDSMVDDLEWRFPNGERKVVESMRKTPMTVPYCETKSFEVIMIPYKDHYSMVIMLPKDESYDPCEITLSDFENNWPRSNRKISLIMPK